MLNEVSLAAGRKFSINICHCEGYASFAVEILPGDTNECHVIQEEVWNRIDLAKKKIGDRDRWRDVAAYCKEIISIRCDQFNELVTIPVDSERPQLWARELEVCWIREDDLFYITLKEITLSEVGKDSNWSLWKRAKPRC